MLNEPIKLNYTSGGFVLIFEEDIPLSKHRQVHSYLKEFSKLINEKQLTPADPYGYKVIQDYFWLLEAIGNIINSQIKWSKIDYQDLFEFFIINFDESGNELISNLGKLLGFSDTNKSEELDPQTNNEDNDILDQAELTTGDILLDVEATTLLTFKYAPQLLERRSLAQLIAMNKFAGDCMEYARRKAKEEAEAEAESKSQSGQKVKTTKVEPAPPLPEESLDFQQQKQAIANNLDKMGIVVPQGF